MELVRIECDEEIVPHGPAAILRHSCLGITRAERSQLAAYSRSSSRDELLTLIDRLPIDDTSQGHFMRSKRRARLAANSSVQGNAVVDL